VIGVPRIDRASGVRDRKVPAGIADSRRGSRCAGGESQPCHGNHRDEAHGRHRVSIDLNRTDLRDELHSALTGTRQGWGHTGEDVTRQTDFESLMFTDVEKRAEGDAGPPQGKPKYYGRPWTQLRDEMLASGARTVGELSTNRIAVHYHSTGSAHSGLVDSLKRLFGTTSSAT
jgi:hypothetical protein